MLNIIPPRDLIILRECPIDTYDIEENIRDFYLSIPSDLYDEEMISKVILAENFTNSSINLVWTLFKRNNEYISLEEHEACESDLGRVRKHIRLARQNVINLSSDEKKISEIAFSFSLMNEAIKHLCFLCFKKVDKDEKDMNKFLGLVFKEFSNSVRYLGALTSEDVTQLPKFPSEIKLKEPTHRYSETENDESIDNIGQPTEQELPEREYNFDNTKRKEMEETIFGE